MIQGDERGLRAVKRRQTFDQILANGVALFRAQGIRGTRTQSIARASAVSAATLFNYFPSKAALAEAWVRGEVDRAVEGAFRGGPDRGLRPALRAVCRALADQVGDAPALHLEAWRTAARIRSRPPGGGEGLVAALRREQADGRVRQDLAPELLAEVLVDALEAGLAAGLRDDERAEGLARGIQARVDLVLDGARKRNERVALARE